MSHIIQSLPVIKEIQQEHIGLDLSFEQAASVFANDPGTVVLLSGSALDCSRYHILGADPWLELRGRGDAFFLCLQGQTYRVDKDIFAFLNDLLGHFKCVSSASSDLPIDAGLLGYFAYDLKDRLEELPKTCRDTGLPDLVLYAPSFILVQDRLTAKTVLSIPVLSTADSKPPIRQVREKVLDRLAGYQPGKTAPSFCVGRDGLTSSYTKPEYVAAVNRIIQYLKEGDIYQANLSQRFETRFRGDAYALFLELYKQNPAPFFSFIHAGDHDIVSTSPERFIKVSGTHIETRPIKGTISRGKTTAQDEQNSRLLTSSLKDDAELTMIVDLMRNDISRVARHESVKVVEHKRLEPYDNVFHLVSVVEGELLPGKTCVDLLKAVFPGGSITGCPKIRSMEIIDELESVRRHVYTGSIGYVSFHGTMDLSIAIRTATIKGDTLCFSVGGGIVYDSDPLQEFQETLDKGRTFLDVLSRAGTENGRPRARAWVDGKIIDQEKAVIPAGISGFQYGAGLFETIRVEKGQPAFLHEHVRRMETGWQALFKSDPPDISWSWVVDLLIRENGFETVTAAVKLIICLTEDHDGPRPFCAAFAREYKKRPALAFKPGLDLVTYPHPRQTPLAAYKTLNYLYYDQAGRFALDNDADEALILNPDHTVSETNTCSILIRENQKIVVPVSDHALDGVTRKVLVNGLKNAGYEVISRPIPLSEFVSCSDIILTNALMGAVPVCHVDGRQIDCDLEFCHELNRLLE